MPESATNLHLTSQVGGQVSFAWDLPDSISTPNWQFLDIATEPGFIVYKLQQQLPTNQNTFSYPIPLPPGSYWARINTHYPGFGTDPLDRGWFPSREALIEVAGGQPLPVGTPATNLRWNAGVISWTRGSGNKPITREALDLSIFPNFDDILTSPYVPPVGAVGTVVGLPFAFDLPPNYNQLQIVGLPVGQTFYARVNTLYDDRAWAVSQIIQFNADGTVVVPPSTGGKFPWILVGAGVGLGVLLLVTNSSEDSDDV